MSSIRHVREKASAIKTNTQPSSPLFCSLLFLKCYLPSLSDGLLFLCFLFFVCFSLGFVFLKFPIFYSFSTSSIITSALSSFSDMYTHLEIQKRYKLVPLVGMCLASLIYPGGTCPRHIGLVTRIVPSFALSGGIWNLEPKNLL